MSIHPQNTSINILQLNINGLPNKHIELESFLNNYNMHIAQTQAPPLPINHTQPTFYKYDSNYATQNTNNHTLSITLILNSVTYTNITSQITNSLTNKITKIQSFSMIVNKKTHNINNLYIPHPTSPY